MYSVKGGFVYIVTNPNHTVLYTGVTSNLKGRIGEHRDRKYPGSFTARYSCYELVYFKGYPFISQAIGEEKRIKAGNRKQKIKLIDSMNPEWKDLWEEIKNWT